MKESNEGVVYEFFRAQGSGDMSDRPKNGYALTRDIAWGYAKGFRSIRYPISEIQVDNVDDIEIFLKSDWAPKWI